MKDHSLTAGERAAVSIIEDVQMHTLKKSLDDVVSNPPDDAVRATTAFMDLFLAQLKATTFCAFRTADAIDKEISKRRAA